MDYRDTANDSNWWLTYNVTRRTAIAKPNIFNDVYDYDAKPIEIQVDIEVCPVCDGAGRYVNPSIDSHGIGADEWMELDDQFKDLYMSGGYDVTCGCCNGMRVTPKPVNDDDIKKLDGHFNELYQYRSEQEAERMMGC